MNFYVLSVLPYFHQKRNKAICDHVPGLGTGPKFVVEPSEAASLEVRRSAEQKNNSVSPSSSWAKQRALKFIAESNETALSRRAERSSVPWRPSSSLEKQPSIVESLPGVAFSSLCSNIHIIHLYWNRFYKFNVIKLSSWLSRLICTQYFQSEHREGTCQRTIDSLGEE